MIRRLLRFLKRLFPFRGREGSRPRAEELLKGERRRVRDSILRCNEALRSHAGLCEGLLTEVRELEEREGLLRGRAKEALRAEDREGGGRAALALEKVREKLEEKSLHLKEAVEAYARFVRARDEAIAFARARLEHFGTAMADLKREEAMAALADLASEVAAAGAGDPFDRILAMVEEERDRAAARARVARDLNLPAPASFPGSAPQGAHSLEIEDS